ncbi:MAG TPA: class II glutamine amidotransferase [Pyrinomonadaceae bacterium]|nr:class II glutamine amidotransferase [Pyrinomonadaceae bacterium]
MCRFLCYMGPEILLSDLLYSSKNSLILQSYKSKERKEPLNGDGFGVGWYTHQIGPMPCVFRSLTPAWNNQNLQRLSEHVKSSCFFAHVRAASPGMGVCEDNCHPFQYGRYLWMHNGTIQGFWQIRRRLRASLPDSLYNAIEGTTDSEHAFAVFLNLLGDTEKQQSASELGQVLVSTVTELERWTAEMESAAPSYYNFAVTDGLNVATIRYVSDPTIEPASLYYAAGKKYQCVNGVCELVDCDPRSKAIVIASERLSDDTDHWLRVAPNHVLTINEDLEANVELMQIERHGSKVETPSLYRRGRQSNHFIPDE